MTRAATRTALLGLGSWSGPLALAILAGCAAGPEQAPVLPTEDVAQDASGTFSVDLLLPETLFEGQQVGAQVVLRNESASVFVYDSVVVEGCPALALQGLSEIFDATEWTTADSQETPARAVRQFPTGYSSAGFVPPGAAKILDAKLKPLQSGTLSVRVRYAPLRQEDLFAKEATKLLYTQGPPAMRFHRSFFRPLRSGEAMPEELVIASPSEEERANWPMAEHRMEISVHESDYTLRRATQDAGIYSARHTFYVPSSHWVVSNGLETVFLKKGEKKSAAGNLVALLDEIDFSDAEAVRCSGDLAYDTDAADKKMDRFIRTFLGIEQLAYKSSSTRFYVPANRMVDFLAGADENGFRLRSAGSDGCVFRKK